jgi:hypothetical protein
VFRWVNCFQQVKHDTEGWDAMYCTEVTTTSILALVNAVLFAFLLVKDIKGQRQTNETASFY